MSWAKIDGDEASLRVSQSYSGSKYPATVTWITPDCVQ